MNSKADGEIDAQLEQARVALGLFAGRLDELVAGCGDVFESKELSTALEAVRTELSRAEARLRAPTLRVATIGTTSSGKSTLVNAIIGRSIAPMLSREMSAGVLRIRHGSHRSLFVHETEGATWDTGELEAGEDDAVYARIEATLANYHAAKARRRVGAPQIDVVVPLLPAVDRALLGLPAGLDLEFVDLPGLKSIQDRRNLEVIQAEVKRCFSVVTLDYRQVDEQHREALLAELGEVVEQLGGRTDSILFVLNRVNERGALEHPLADEIALLAEEIKTVLGLPDTPSVLPVDARMLYYLQNAWGPATSVAPSTTPEDRARYLKAFFTDCGNAPARFDDEEAADWLHARRHELKTGTLSDSDLHHLVYRYGARWSHSEGLWLALRKRLSERFRQLVVFPAFLELLLAHRRLDAVLTPVLSVRRDADVAGLRGKANELKALKLALLEESRLSGTRFRTLLRDSLEALTTGDYTVEQANKVAALLGPRFGELPNTVSSLKQHLYVQVTKPLCSALAEGHTVRRLTEQLDRVHAQPRTKLVDAYDSFRSAYYSREAAAEGLVLEEEPTDSGRKALESAGKMRGRLDVRLNRALTSVAEHELQARTGRFREALLELATTRHLQVTQLAAKSTSLSPAAEVLATELAAYGEYLNGLQLPEGMLAPPKVGGPEAATRQVRVGTKRVQGPTFCDPDRVVPVFENEGFLRLTVPPVKELEAQWTAGVSDAEGAFWHRLAEWFSKDLEHLDRVAGSALERFFEVLEREYARRLEQIETGEMNVLRAFEAADDARAQLAGASAAMRAAAGV